MDKVRQFATIGERDAFIDKNFPDRKFYGDGSLPGFYELPGKRFLSVLSLNVRWGELSEEDE